MVEQGDPVDERLAELAAKPAGIHPADGFVDQIMAAVELLKNNPKPTDADIDREMTNICRCGTFQQIRAAIHAAAKA